MSYLDQTYMYYVMYVCMTKVPSYSWQFHVILLCILADTTAMVLYILQWNILADQMIFLVKQ